MKHRILIILTVLFSFVVNESKAQGIAVNTNIAGWAALAPNLGVDLCMNEYSSVEAIFYKSATKCWFKDIDFMSLQLGYRYWFSRTPLNNFFVGATVTPTKYEMQTKNFIHDGYALPFGVNIGYCLPLSDRWNIEISYGIGATYLYEDLLPRTTATAENLLPNETKRDFLLTPSNLGINISYVIK